ncbi:hypothetical protein N9Y42_05475 [Mariniblastus sp.]|nr:hypothetical protein [Mariniblastus sp.]
MSLNLRFRIVGLYCFAPSLLLANVNPDSTVKAVMDEVKNSLTSFDYVSGPLPNGKEIVDTMEYDFSSNSVRPPNTKQQPSNGQRDLENQMGATSNIWQYYRGATGIIEGQTVELRARTPGQPSFANTELNEDLYLPSNFQLETINLTWRLVRLQLAPEKQMKFLEAKINAKRKLAVN